ncbi:ribonuclease HII [Helicobacter sp. 12S02634-8]|uniref:DUF2156 domain-containing protein n=1 Tax=Helicobacter sp. 12S02634-8 TaxID=1476199 RepID=UPI000BA688FC|nr:phosphatidylglycerol lysyltransferase domain-containing protein [Helicobacter sp. 12S02634-8]PAF48070.1 ribonuclease HII [Helicobacter sp. 12S02634-8]
MATINILEYKLKPFVIETKEIMESYLRKTQVEVSDYSFAANYIWLSRTSGFYEIIDDTFCLFVMTGGELSMLLPPLGKPSQCYSAIPKCFDIMNENNSSNYYSKIEYVCDEFLEGFITSSNEGEVIFSSLENYVIEKKLVDYIYKTNDLIELKGNAYHAKRNEINKFKKAYPDFSIQTLDPENHAIPINHLFNKWVSDRMKYMPKEEIDVFMDGIYQERLAVKRVLQDYCALGLVGLVIYIGDELKGFTVGEQVREDTASVLIEKTDFEVLGCAQFIFREFCKVLKERYNTEYINVGDDMGFENLKKVKMSYRPEKLVPKYTIYQK